MSKRILTLAVLSVVAATALPAVEAAEGEEQQALRQCCECICAPHYPDPFCFLGDCIWVPASESCPSPYMEPADCPVGEGADSDSHVPSYVEVGDLLFISAKPLVEWAFGFDYGEWDHVAMYIGDDLFVEAVAYPGSECVRPTPLWFFYLWADELAYAKVTSASDDQKQDAADWALSRLYDPYQDTGICWWANADPDDPDDPYSDWWYCTELVWAAYMNVEPPINIDGTPSPPDGVHLCVTLEDILFDDDIEVYPNAPPSAPVQPSGPTDVYRWQMRFYTTSAVDPDNDPVRYKWDWEESADFLWGAFHDSGDAVTKGHRWDELGWHCARARAQDIWGNVGPWSECLMVLVRSWYDGSLEASDVAVTIDGSFEVAETGDLIEDDMQESEETGSSEYPGGSPR